MKKLFYSLALWYLRTATHVQIRKINPIIIGVAGSSGKSSLSRLIVHVLQSKGRVKNSEGKNSETGIPLDILGIHMRNFSKLSWLLAFLLVPLRLLTDWKKYDYYVAEMGIDSPVEPKNMSYLLKIIQPTIGVVTNVSLEHSVYFEPFVDEPDPKEKQEKILEMTAEQETMPLKSLPSHGKAIVNIDDEQIKKAQATIKTDKITVSLREKADLYGKEVKNTLEHFSMDVIYRGKTYPLIIPQPLPFHFAYEFLFAIAVGISLDVPIDVCIHSLVSQFSLPPGRLSFFKGIKNTTIIDSTYNNATLPPILDILDFVKEISGKKRKVAIIGDMRELGEESKYAHEELAKKIAKTVDYAILIGPQLEEYAVPSLKKTKLSFQSFPTVRDGKDTILQAIQTGDVILVKGSQNTLFLERVVQMLLLDKKDTNKLTRRGEFWDKKRLETP